MMRRLAFCLLLAAIAPLPAAAQAPTPAAAPAPANLAAARAVVDLVMPPASRDQMMNQMMQGMNQSMLSGFMQSPQLKEAFDRDPRVRPIFEKFMARQQAETGALLKTQLPGLATAMTRAYARRFSVDQLGEMQRFFASSTGQAYIAGSPSIMSDPDVSSWSQVLMGQALAKGPAQARALTDEIAALPPLGGVTK